ncbi:hypothetical protein SAMN05421874_128119 [Nonomuraea maritima]|uniref:Uncharacterized protein n=1 Tax=Nonomuraea maritima TaxID=683260 RepID=A0A1G9MPF6_9ACTN|nr:hypothetical protein [Nonomuraea maritima]SDL75891.1 hypothetical protein SAMN05421874_128119 [Nonomuraea maritima]
MTTMKPIKFSVAMLNSAPYQDPNGRHPYVMTARGEGREWMHIAGCPLLQEHPVTREDTGTYGDLCSYTAGTLGCDRCLPHAGHHVVLPDGGKRYRPMGPIAHGRHGDRDVEFGEYALVNQSGGRWQVREWAADGQAALDRAKALGITVILGPPDKRYGLPMLPEGQA